MGWGSELPGSMRKCFSISPVGPHNEYGAPLTSQQHTTKLGPLRLASSPKLKLGYSPRASHLQKMSSQTSTVSRILHIARLTNNPESRLLCLTVMHRHRRVAVVKVEALYPQSQSWQTQGRNVVTNHRLHCCICDHFRPQVIWKSLQTQFMHPQAYQLQQLCERVLWIAELWIASMSIGWIAIEIAPRISPSICMSFEQWLQSEHGRKTIYVLHWHDRPLITYLESGNGSSQKWSWKAWEESKVDSILNL